MAEQRDIDIILESPIDWEAFRGKTVLVTGATGRLGMYIVEALAHADIEWNLSLHTIAMARSAEKLQRVFGETLGLPNVSTVVQDITASFENLPAIDSTSFIRPDLRARKTSRRIPSARSGVMSRAHGMSSNVHGSRSIAMSSMSPPSKSMVPGSMTSASAKQTWVR